MCRCITLVNGAMVAASPTYLRTQSGGSSREGCRCLRILAGAEEDAARALLLSLDGSQREKAIYDKTAPRPATC